MRPASTASPVIRDRLGDWASASGVCVSAEGRRLRHHRQHRRRSSQRTVQRTRVQSNVAIVQITDRTSRRSRHRSRAHTRPLKTLWNLASFGQNRLDTRCFRWASVAISVAQGLADEVEPHWSPETSRRPPRRHSRCGSPSDRRSLWHLREPSDVKLSH
jgi:hypothetical protein